MLTVSVCESLVDKKGPEFLYLLFQMGWGTQISAQIFS